LTSLALEQLLRPPPGSERLPDFADGWRGEDGSVGPYVSYVEQDHEVNWSAELEELHEESSRDHFLDVWTRRSMLERLGPVPSQGIVVDLGCSTGYLLEDLTARYPQAVLFGVDLVASGLAKAHQNAPGAHLLQADVCALPFADASVDAAVSANLLEHVPDDQLALTELCRVLRPGARAVVVVPASPGVCDYYDRFLGHQRRYARSELASKAVRAGLQVIEDVHLGSLLYPPFWLVKQRNRRRFGHLQGTALEERVAADIAGTRDSRLGALSCALERAMLRAGIRLPFGIRGLTVVRRPGESK
jgi:SAM-dependent methyltransferase